MLVSLFTSRALLSVSFIIFLLLTCFHKNLIRQIIGLFKNRFLWGSTLLFFIPLMAWFWSADKEMWARIIRIKLPLFFFPLAFAGNWQLKEKQWRWIAFTFLLLVFAGCCWSFAQYVSNPTLVHENYLKAKVFDTPFGNDHVRFSLVVCIAVICSVLLITKTHSQRTKAGLFLLALFFVAYLHILSARTGLIALYIFLISGFFYLIFFQKKTKWSFFILMFVLAMPFFAWFVLPTFQNRIKYIVYDLSFVKQGQYLPGANDGNRILSLKAGWHVLKENPWGAGVDVVHKTNEWYNKNIPQMLEQDKIFPSSEYLMYAGFAGWPGLLLFIAVMAGALFENIKTKKFFWYILNGIFLLSFLFDIGLEVQFGVFIYAFIVLWWWKWLGADESPM